MLLCRRDSDCYERVRSEDFIHGIRPGWKSAEWVRDQFYFREDLASIKIVIDKKYIHDFYDVIIEEKERPENRPEFIHGYHQCDFCGFLCIFRTRGHYKGFCSEYCRTATTNYIRYKVRQIKTGRNLFCSDCKKCIDEDGEGGEWSIMDVREVGLDRYKSKEEVFAHYSGIYFPKENIGKRVRASFHKRIEVASERGVVFCKDCCNKVPYSEYPYIECFKCNKKMYYFHGASRALIVDKKTIDEKWLCSKRCLDFYEKMGIGKINTTLCKYCKRRFNYKISEKKRKFCSKECRCYSRKNIPYIPKGNCKYCHKKIRYRRGERKRKFCSGECRRNSKKNIPYVPLSRFKMPDFLQGVSECLNQKRS